VRDARAEALAIEHLHALAVADLPDHHRDPFDRMLISQAVALRVPILTADPAFDAYDVEVVAA
jgi:PIN domain nuclease of toxin-antitoxin system